MGRFLARWAALIRRHGTPTREERLQAELRKAKAQLAAIHEQLDEYRAANEAQYRASYASRDDT